MMYTIRIKDLALQTILGTYDWEKTQKRPVVLNIEMQLRAPEAAGSDALAHTVDYAQIEQAVILHVESNRFELIERLTNEVADLILSLDARIERVMVEADKPGALKQARSVSVSVTSARPS